MRPDAQNVGGLNLFGREFGNYPQDLGLRVEYDLAGAPVTEPEPIVETLVSAV